MLRPASAATLSVLLLTSLLAIPGILAGSAAEPEITDPANDDGTASTLGSGASDIIAAWLATEDNATFTFTIQANGDVADFAVGPGTIIDYSYTISVAYDGGTAVTATVGADGAVDDGPAQNVATSGDTITFEVTKAGIAADVQPGKDLTFSFSTSGKLVGQSSGEIYADTAPDSGTATYLIGSQAEAGVDYDLDGYDDADELAHNGTATDPVDNDTDDDGAMDGEEIAAGSDPHNPDTDGDGALDGAELAAGSDPTVTDTDGDGRSDGEELNRPAGATDPTNPDTDDDGAGDGVEHHHETDPLNPDTDGDGIPDGLEIELGLDPLDPADATADPDKDEVNTIDEIEQGTDPFTADHPNLFFGYDVGFDVPLHGDVEDWMWAAALLLLLIILILLIILLIRALTTGDEEEEVEEELETKVSGKRQKGVFLSREWIVAGLRPSQKVRALRRYVEDEVARRDALAPGRPKETDRDLEDANKLRKLETRLEKKEAKEVAKLEKKRLAAAEKGRAIKEQDRAKAELAAEKIRAEMESEISKIQAKAAKHQTA